MLSCAISALRAGPHPIIYDYTLQQPVFSVNTIMGIFLQYNNRRAREWIEARHITRQRVWNIMCNVHIHIADGVPRPSGGSFYSSFYRALSSLWQVISFFSPFPLYQQPITTFRACLLFVHLFYFACGDERCNKNCLGIPIRKPSCQAMNVYAKGWRGWSWL